MQDEYSEDERKSSHYGKVYGSLDVICCLPMLPCLINDAGLCLLKHEAFNFHFKYFQCIRVSAIDW